MNRKDEIGFILGAGMPVVITPESHLYFAANTLVAMGVPSEVVRRSLRRLADSDVLWDAYDRVQAAVARVADTELEAIVEGPKKGETPS